MRMQGEKQTLTGCVVDSGHGITHIIPVVDGFVIGSCIRSIPLAGRDITSYVQQALRYYTNIQRSPLQKTHECGSQQAPLHGPSNLYTSDLRSLRKFPNP